MFCLLTVGGWMHFTSHKRLRFNLSILAQPSFLPWASLMAEVEFPPVWCWSQAIEFYLLQIRDRSRQFSRVLGMEEGCCFCDTHTRQEIPDTTSSSTSIIRNNCSIILKPTLGHFGDHFKKEKGFYGNGWTEPVPWCMTYERMLKSNRYGRGMNLTWNFYCRAS